MKDPKNRRKIKNILINPGFSDTPCTRKCLLPFGYYRHPDCHSPFTSLF